jgi:putative flavoprotein involved in K+ transport
VATAQVDINRITSSTVGEVIDTVVIGAGHAGLALSCYLSRKGTKHVVLELGQVGKRWRTERWDSLVFQFPNWSLQLPDYTYQGPDPDGYPSKDEFIRLLEDYASGIRAPVRCNTEVLSLRHSEDGRSMEVATARGDIRAKNVVVATGPFQAPKIPVLSRELPPDLFQIHSRAIEIPLNCREVPHWLYAAARPVRRSLRNFIAVAAG